MKEQKKKIHEKFSLPGLSQFNIPSISQFSNHIECSLKLITTEKNIEVSQSQLLDHEIDNRQNSEEWDSLALRMQQQEPVTSLTKKKRTGCTCKKTFCLKMYCECFASFKLCDQSCVCCNCRNTSQNNRTIKMARLNVKQNGTHTCEIQQKRCNCKKSLCRKKYCECYNAGIQCSTSCKCIQCGNKGKKADGADQQFKKGQLAHTESLLQKSVDNFQNI